MALARRRWRARCSRPISTTTARSTCWCPARGDCRAPGWPTRPTRLNALPAADRRGDLWPWPTTTTTGSSICWASVAGAAGRWLGKGTPRRTTGRPFTHARAAERGRPAHQLVRRRRRDRGPSRPAVAEAGAAAAVPVHFGLGPRTDHRRRAHRLAQRRAAGGVRHRRRRRVRRRAAAEGLVPVGVRLRRPRRCASSPTSSGARRSACASTRRTPPASTQTEDWVRIRGDQLVPRDGAYDVRITAELWETHFFDHVSLMVVDHPADSEVFVDERFSAGAPPRLAVQALRTAAAGGPRVRRRGPRRDGARRRARRPLPGHVRARAPIRASRATHSVEIDLPAAAAAPPSLCWSREGWVYPTDSSINVAMAQGGAAQPRGLALDAQDASGAWRVVDARPRIPGGQEQDDADRPGAGAAARARLRLRTNLEIYWDRLARGRRARRAAPRSTRLAARRARTCGIRGFSQTIVAARRGAGDARLRPAREHGAALARPRWLSHALRRRPRAADGRRRSLRHHERRRRAAPASSRSGPRRRPAGAATSCSIGDGWEKDGDFNTGFSQTVLPLPSHAQAGLRRRAAAPASSKTIRSTSASRGLGARSTRGSSRPTGSSRAGSADAAGQCQPERRTRARSMFGLFHRAQARR